MIEAFIENQPTDISEVFSTFITLAIDDVEDFGAKSIVPLGTWKNHCL